MQNNLTLLKQAFANTIQGIDKTLVTSLYNRLSKKTMFIISAITAFVIISITAMYKVERKFAERNFIKKEHILGNFVKEDIVRMSRIKFNRLNKFAKEKLDIDLNDDNCVKKYINVYCSCRDRVYPVVSALYDARNNVNHPLHGKDCYDLKFIYSNQSLFDVVKDCSPSRLKNSIVATDEMINNKLLDIAEKHYPNKSEVSEVGIYDFNDLSKIRDFNIRTFFIGSAGNFVYLANEQGSLRKYDSYIRFIRRENK